MGPGLAGLLKEARLLREVIAFAGDTLRKRPSNRLDSSPKPVLLIPGLMASDTTLYPLASRLRASGYRVFFAGIWCNLDCPARTIKRLERSLVEAGRATASKVIIIGHSLGGIYARELARRFPLLVERAILLGSPLKDPVESSNHLLRAAAAFLRMANPSCLGALGETCEACGLDLPGMSPRVPETIVYTKSDGVVNWRSCLESGAQVEAVEVRSSHCGLALSREVWDVVLERLARTPARATPRHAGHDSRYRLFRSRPPIARIPSGRTGEARHAAFDRVEIAAELRCEACNSDFAHSPGGNRVLLLKLGMHRTVYFCSACGDNIGLRVGSDAARKRYVWYWAVPLKSASPGAA